MSNPTRLPLEVLYDDGEVVTVEAGQREMAAYEMAGYGSSGTATDDKPMLFFRVLAFEALRRTGQLRTGTGKFELWNKTVDEVMPPEEVTGSGADPTQEGQPPVGSSG